MKKVIMNAAGLLLILLLVTSFSLLSALAQTNRGMGVAPEALPKELRDLSPKDSFVPSSQKKVGVIHALEGKVVVLHRATREAYFGMEGDAIYENDSLNTLADSRCRIRFVDEDVVTMAPDTEFSVENFQDQRAQGKKSSLFGMLKGKAMFYAMRLFRYKDTRFTLNTPTVTVGVRGTKFGAHVYYVGEKKADRGILVADTGNEIGPYLAQAGAGGQSFTDAFSEDGVLNVGGQIVNPGQMFNGQTGQVIPTPPSVLQSFRQATGMGPQRSQEPTTQEEGGPSPGGTGEQNTLQTVADLQENLTTVTQVTVGREVEEEKKGEKITPYPGPLYGYFALLLHKNPQFKDAFLNYTYGYSPGLVHDDTELRGYGVINSWDYLAASSSYTDEAYIGGSSASILQNVDGTEYYIGQNAYAQWGYWKADAPTSFTITGGSYPGTYSFVSDQAWFVEAKHITTATEIAAVATGDYAYSGEAHGTYYNGSTAANMSGTFNSTVHFGSAYVKDFNLSVAGGGHSASFAWSGSEPIESVSSGNYFHVGSGGTSTIDGSTVSYGKVSGSLVGHNGEGMIGAWGVACSTTGVGASGIYSGTRK